MHTNTYDHANSESGYKRYISNIAYRFKFEVIEDQDMIWKVEDGVSTKLADGEEIARNTIWYSAWMKLQEEYGYSGIWKDK